MTPTGTFEVVTEAEAVWDTANLYTTGEVTLVSAVPEPSTLALLTITLLSLLRWRLGGL